jgi:hypothetical protein
LQNCKKQRLRFVLSEYPSVQSHGTTQLPLDNLYRHLIFEDFFKCLSRKFKFD